MHEDAAEVCPPCANPRISSIMQEHRMTFKLCAITRILPMAVLVLRRWFSSAQVSEEPARHYYRPWGT